MLHIQTFGAPTNRPLLIAHGLFGAGRNWSAIARALSDNRHVITVDMRNHGDSFWADDHTYPALAEDLAEVIAAQGGQMDVIGHSMGGKSAMTLALRTPDAVNKLLIADIAPVAYAHDQMQYIAAMRGTHLAGLKRRSQVQQALMDQGVGPDVAPFLAQSANLDTGTWQYNLDALAANMPEILAFPDISAPPFPRPTLFLSGANSDYVLPAHRPAIKARFTNPRFAKLTGAGHWLHAEKPEAFIQAVRVFLAN